MLKEEKVLDHKVSNLIHTFLLLGAILLLSGLVAVLLFGMAGLLAVTIALAALLLFSPQISLPLILKVYKARPLSHYEAESLYRISGELARRAGVTNAPQLYYVPSRIINAFSVGRREEAAIGLTDGLLRNLNMYEITAILAHEMSHIRNNDMRVMGMADLISRITNIFSTMGQLLLIINLPLFLFGYATVPFLVIILLITAPTLSGLLQLALSRTREFDADLDAARITGDPRGLASALKKIEYYSGGGWRRLFLPGHGIPNPSIFRTHPQTDERVNRLMALEAEKYPSMEDMSSLAEELFSMPSELRHVTRKPRWRIGGIWY